ncbi:MAG: hypothetical protein IPI71_06115 [Methanolinea sp.]|nr:MAG: hypothetical protein IPI71_06115 [Methanolinea sp.]
MREGGRDVDGEDADELMMTMTFKDATSFAGDISTFAKSMSWNSKFA